MLSLHTELAAQWYIAAVALIGYCQIVAGLQGSTCAWGDQGVAVHHPHEAHLPH